MVSLRLGVSALCVAAVVFSYQLGARRGSAKSVADARQQYTLETAALQTKLTELQSDLAGATQELAVNSATLDQLKKELIEQGQSNFAESRELSLYRQIENASSRSGLAIDDLKISVDESGTPSGLMFTLMQFQGRGRVEGTVLVRLEGRHDAERFQQVLTSTDSAAGMPFDIRFFKPFKLPLKLPKNIRFDTLEISITPKGKTHKPTKKLYPWDEIPTHRP